MSSFQRLLIMSKRLLISIPILTDLCQRFLIAYLLLSNSSWIRSVASHWTLIYLRSSGNDTLVHTTKRDLIFMIENFASLYSSSQNLNLISSKPKWASQYIIMLALEVNQNLGDLRSIHVNKSHKNNKLWFNIPQFLRSIPKERWQ